MKRLLSFLIILCLAGSALANGVSLNSPGTRAISMGGAYISHVNDYSTPYWNPAGLMNVEGMQASFFITDIIPMAGYKIDAYGIDTEAETNHLIAPNASFLWTCKFNDKLHLGLSAIVPAGLGVQWKGEDLSAFTGGDAMKWESSIAVMNFSLSAAMRFGDKLNLGAAFHLVNGSMTLDKGLANPMGGGAQFSEESSGWGFGAGFGAQYMATDKITLGAALRTKMAITFEGDAENPLMPLMAANPAAPTKSDFEREMTWPLWVGGGVAFQATDKLLLALEGQWSQWSETQDVLTAKYDDATWDAALTASDGDKLYLHWDDALQIRLGAEYLVNDQWAVRAGAYTDPAPGPDETQTILIPNTDFTGLCGGFGYNMDKWSFDFGLEYLIGKERDIDVADATDHNMPGTHTLDIFVLSGAVTYKFK